MAFRRSVRIAALFSGGKDSTYAAYVAVQRGWELTHLLSVIPEDRDSMLFHVPNLSMTALLAQAMHLPLLTEAAKTGEAGELDALRRIFRRIDADGGRLAGPRGAPGPEGRDPYRRRTRGTVRRSRMNWNRSSLSAIFDPAPFASFRHAFRSRVFPAIAKARARASYA